MGLIIAAPRSAVIVLIGASGAGKSTFARRHFGAYEIVSSDQCRAMVSDDENNQAATDDAFELLYCIVERRLHRHRLCVIDATNVKAKDRRGLVEIARKYQVPAIAIVFRLPEQLHYERSGTRADRTVPDDAIAHQLASLHDSAGGLIEEGFHTVHLLASEQDVASVQVVRTPE